MRDAFLLRPYHSPYFSPILRMPRKRRARVVFLGDCARVIHRICLQQQTAAKDAVPKNYDGLLHPALKGRMGVSVSDPAYKVIGAMLRTKGKEFVQKLRGRKSPCTRLFRPRCSN